MGKTSIEWVRGQDGSEGKSWNPIRARNRETGKVGWACVHVSPGCEHCYSEAFNAFRGTGLKYRAQDLKHVESFLDPKTLAAPLSWKRPCKIFVCSMTDLFGEWVPFEQIATVFGVMAACPQHTFIVLTKRPERAREFFAWIEEKGQQAAVQGGDVQVRFCVMAADHFIERGFHVTYPPWPLPNVWLLTSAEDQETAEKRIPHLLKCPATVHGVSYEPALSRVDFSPWLRPEFTVHRGDTVLESAEGRAAITAIAKAAAIQAGARFIGWLIAGGESGPRARPMHPDWARSVRDQCQAAGVPYFFKQWGEWAPTDIAPGGDLGGDMRCGLVEIVRPAGEMDGHFRKGDVLMRRLGKKVSGALLDGREWREFPEPRP